MKTKKPQPSIEIKTLLVISKPAFEAEIDDFLQKYRELAKSVLTNEHGLDESQEIFNRISEIAAEFLKHAFNKPNNEYKHDFEMCDSGIGIVDVIYGVDIHEFTKKLEYFTQQLQCKVRYLEQLKQSLKYLPVDHEARHETANDYFSRDEKISIDNKIDEILIKLNELLNIQTANHQESQMGQQVIFDEVEQLKDLKHLTKTNFGQIVKDKLVDLILSKAISKDVGNWILDQFKTATEIAESNTQS